MVRFVKFWNGDAGKELMRLEQMAAEWRGEVLAEIFIAPTYEGERVGDNGAYLIFKPKAQLDAEREETVDAVSKG